MQLYPIALALGVVSTASAVGCMGGIDPISIPPRTSPTTAVPRSGFVRRDGNRFALNGIRYQFVGANARILQGRNPRDQIETTIEAAARSVDVLRVWVFGDGPRRDAVGWERDFYFRMGPDGDGVIETSYEALDRVLAAARTHGVRLILTFGNHWADYGGIQRYYEWFNSPPTPVGRRAERRRPTDQEALFFYRDRRARAAYKDGLRRVLRRTNTITTIPYYEDPTILAVELLNEPRATAAYADAQIAWMAEMSGYVRALAPHHLIGAGVDTAFVRSELSVAQWQAMGELRHIDYFDMHLYPGSTHSTDAPLNSAALESRLAEAERYAHRVAGKPIVIGEIGYDEETARYFQRERSGAHVSRQELLNRAIRSALIRHGIDGVLFWIFRPMPDPLREPHRIHPDFPDDQRFLERMRDLKSQLPRETSGN